MPDCVELLAAYEDQQIIVTNLETVAGLASQAAADANQAVTDARTTLQDIMNQMIGQGCFGGGA